MGRRWPGWVYDEGTEPDPRFSLANERTFLAWVRTALAMLAGGVALQAFPVALHAETRRWLSVFFILLALMTAAAGWWRWARIERAVRREQPLPGSALSVVLTAAVVIAAIVLLVVVSLA